MLFGPLPTNGVSVIGDEALVDVKIFPIETITVDPAPDVAFIKGVGVVGVAVLKFMSVHLFKENTPWLLNSTKPEAASGDIPVNPQFTNDAILDVD